MKKGALRPRLLHILGTGDDAAARRCARLVKALNAFDHAVAHDPAFTVPGDRQSVRFPPLDGKPWPGRLLRLARAMEGFDLICTHGWGAIDAALAHTLFADVVKLAPLVVHDDDGRSRGAVREYYRRIALGRSAALVVPSRWVERIALERWQQPRSRVRLIADGIDLRAVNRAPKRDALPRVIKQRDERWIGTFAGIDGGNDLPLLVRACASLGSDWHLVILGDGAGRDRVMAEAERCEMFDRVHWSEPPAEPGKVIGLFDIYAQLGGNAPVPEPVVQAMAVGLPVIAPRAGEIAAALATQNGPLLHASGDGPALAAALDMLARDPALRKAIGEANRTKARAEFDAARMIAQYRALYANLLGRPPAA